MKKSILFLLFIAQIVSAQTVRKYSNKFLNIGVDAVAFGMSKSVVATSRDVNSSYWNPAVLTTVTDYQDAFMHAEYFR